MLLEQPPCVAVVVVVGAWSFLLLFFLSDTFPC